MGVVDFCLSFAAIHHALSKVEGLSGIHNQFLIQKQLFRAISHPSTQALFQAAEISPEFVVEPGRQRQGPDVIPPTQLAWLDAQLRHDDRVQAALQSGASFF